ncbi:MAG: 2-dehydropantoate 2-reductase [Candidatus Eremiobacteraeota bacterium]|nr:2-dehydropantoate 2-reductase [Candidatus Eremiobacteraeota bacterium]
MRIVVLGAGGIGGFAAAALARAGYDVAVVARGPHLDAIRTRGLHVRSVLGEFTVRVPASDRLAELGTFDLAIAGFKAHQWADALEQLAPAAHEGLTIVTLQNGVPFWFARTPPLESVDPGGRIGALFPDAQTIGGVVHASGHIPEPGSIRQSGRARYLFGDAAGGAGDRVRELCEMFRVAGMEPEPDENIRATVWLKLVNNAGLNPVSTLRGVTVHRMLEDPAAFAEVRELMLEAIAVGRALGAIENVDVEDRLAALSSIADVKTSMLQDFEAGRKLETGPILGALIELAGRCGVRVPLACAAEAALEAKARC